MRIFDVTVAIRHGMPVYEGDPGVSIAPWCSTAQGALANVSLLTMGSHSGTHVDAPAHLRDGTPGVDLLALEAMMGPARVFDLTGHEQIDAASLRAVDLGSRPRILFKTRNSARWREGRFHRDFAALTQGAARLLVSAGCRLVGMDGLSVDPFGSSALTAHHILVEGGVIILEGLDLSAVPPGEYELICLPLKLQGGDGAPARVVLREIAG